MRHSVRCFVMVARLAGACVACGLDCCVCVVCVVRAWRTMLCVRWRDAFLVGLTSDASMQENARLAARLAQEQQAKEAAAAAAGAWCWLAMLVGLQAARVVQW